MRRPHSSTFVRTFDAPSQAMWAPPSCATESSPYSLTARAAPTVEVMPLPAADGISPRNSSRKRRRTDFADREYRAKSAPLTVSGRFVSANTGRSVFVKYGASARVSSGVNVSVVRVGKDTVVGYSTSHAVSVCVPSSALGTVSRLRCDGSRQPRGVLYVLRAMPPDVLARADRCAGAVHARDHRARRVRL